MQIAGIKCILIVVTVLFFFPSCSNDSTEELSGSYFLRMEGKELNDILSHSGDRKEIPANILSFNYDSDFIIASQKPDKTDDPLYVPVSYERGRDSIYYWIIIHSKRLTLGPMNKHEFDSARQTYNVPSDLQLKSVDWQ